MSFDTQSNPALQRLLRDLDECRENCYPISTISASPIDDNNIFEWHANIYCINGAYKGKIIHLVFLFGKNYPESPPKVIFRVKYFNHPIIFKNWNAGYSVLSFLSSLQSLLHSGKGVLSSRDAEFTHCTCKHSKDNPFPALDVQRIHRIYYKAKENEKLKNNNNRSTKRWNKYLANVELIVFKYLNKNDLIEISNVCKLFRLGANNVYKKNYRYVCWYTRDEINFNDTIKKNYNEEYNPRYIIGYGINCHNKLWGPIATSYNTISLDASKYCYNVNDLHITHFIPLYINKIHGNISLNIVEKTIYKILNRNDPRLLIDFISNIMKKIIVDYEIMELESSSVLETYYRYYQLLLAIYIKHKQYLQAIIDKKIKKFIENKNWRNNIPNLGLFWTYKKFKIKTMNVHHRMTFPYKDTLYISLTDKYQWSDVCHGLLEELFERNVEEFLKEYPFLSFIKRNEYSCNRFYHTFKGSLSNLKSFLFEYFLLKNCCNTDINIEERIKIYNEDNGNPPLELIGKLEKFGKKVSNINNYVQFFDIIDIKCPSNKQLNNLICNSINNSSYKCYNYHETTRGYLKQQSHNCICSHIQKRNVKCIWYNVERLIDVKYNAYNNFDFYTLLNSNSMFDNESDRWSQEVEVGDICCNDYENDNVSSVNNCKNKNIKKNKYSYFAPTKLSFKIPKIKKKNLDKQE